MSYTGYEIVNANVLKAFLPPKFDKVAVHHITYEFPSNTMPPNVNSIVLGEYFSNEFIEAATVLVDGSSIRPDGGTFHITWSYDPNNAKPVDSNKLIKNGTGRKLVPVKVDVIPKIFK